MKTIIGICGLHCNECGAYQATLTGDQRRREEVAEEWSRMFGKEIKAQDIVCEGCTSGSDVLFEHCRVCEIRACGEEMEVVNCSFCGSYPCLKLEDFFKLAPEAKKNLEEIRNS